METNPLVRMELRRAGATLIDMGGFLLLSDSVPLDDIADGVAIMKEHVDNIHNMMQFVKTGAMSRVVEEIIEKAKEHKG